VRRIISRKAKESIRKYILENITLADYGAEESLIHTVFSRTKNNGKAFILATPQLSDIGCAVHPALWLLRSPTMIKEK